MRPAVPGIVLDCMIFLQAAARPNGPAGACVALAERGQVRLYLSAAVLREIEVTLTRPALRKKFQSLTHSAVQQHLEQWTEYAAVVDEVPEVFDYPRDHNDEPYINLAIAAGADYLVSRDKDLLDLMDESTPEGKDFRERFPGLMIMDPAAFLRILADAG